ncbi:hypothetical protein ACIG3E_05495 [Streptomyces sp. NPDC053474]|uniref:hypothetical protein n=1 Tax=Streptomyces sp. NPDC053474 TaxID=3365704 RepID=UPI0037D1C96F
MILGHIDSYVPRAAGPRWGRVAPLVRQIVREADPLLPYKTTELLGVLAKLALFADDQGMESSARVWLSAEFIERFVQVGCPGVGEATRGNYRSRLLRLREAVIGPPLVTGMPAKLSASDASRPYSPTEQAALWGWAAGQPTMALRSGCRVLLALGLGVGLDSAEVVPVRAHDVRTVGADSPVTVAVRGPRQRLVVCRRRIERVLADEAEAAVREGQTSYLFRPAAMARGKNTVTNFLARTVKDPKVPALSMGRARATWLVALIDEGLPLTVIVAASGVQTLHGLSRVLPFARPAHAQAAAELLRGTA